MSEPIVLSDADLEKVLKGRQPALILLSTGDGLRSDFASAFKKAAGENNKILFARIDPSCNPQAVAHFEADSKPLLIGWHHGQQIARRSRPWGSDVPLIIEMLQSAAQNDISVESEDLPVSEELPVSEQPVNQPQTIEDTPFIVTDDTFEAEVLNYDKPVLVDFWAEWCGPCRMVAPILEKLAKEFAGQVRIAKVDVDANPGLSQAFRVMSIPTIMLIKERTIVFSQPGALPENAFRELIQKLIALEVPKQEQPAN